MSALNGKTAHDVLSAMESASAEGDLQEVKALLEQLSPTITNGTTNGDQPPLETDEDLKITLQAALVEAARHGHAAVGSLLLDRGAKITSSVLSGAKESKSTSVYQALLDHGWDINSKWWKGLTSLG